MLLVLVPLMLGLGAVRLWGVPMYETLPSFAHAGGAIGKATYINGLSALDNSYASGFRDFEIDFERTSDGWIVCGHDWALFGNRVPDFTAFLARRATMQYPVCTYDELVAWFRRHRDSTLIPDAKIDVALVVPALEASLGGQVLPEVYSREDLASLGGEGHSPLVLALYKQTGFFRRLDLIMAAHGQGTQFAAVAMSGADAMFGLALWAKLWLRAPVYVYTVDSCNAAFLLRAAGVDAVFTDSLGANACR